MKTAQDFQDLVDNAYSAYKSVANNVAQVNAAVAAILAAAQVAAKNGAYTYSYAFGELSARTDIANAIFYKRYIGEILEGQDFVVEFSYTSNEDWVILSWDPDQS